MTNSAEENTIKSRQATLRGLDDFAVHEHKVFDVNLNPSRDHLPRTLIVHIGAGGGTGGPVMSNLLRTIAGFPQHMRDTVAYIAVDGDHFEPKNLGRQLCTPSDMGKNKVVTLVSKFKRVYELNDALVLAVPRFLDGVPMLEQIVQLGKKAFADTAPAYKDYISAAGGSAGRAFARSSSPNYLPIHLVIIDSVDRNVCRKYITEFLLNFSNLKSLVGSPNRSLSGGYGVTQISCGNGAWDGQTLVGHIAGRFLKVTVTPATTLPDGKFDPQVRDELLRSVFFKSIKTDRSITDTEAYSYNLVLPGLVHPELLDEELDRREDAMSCSERAVANIQHLNANNMGAMAAVNYATAVLMQHYALLRKTFAYWRSEQEPDAGEQLLTATPAEDEDFYAFKNQGFYFNSLNNAVRTSGLGGDNLKAFEKKVRGLD